MRIERIVSHGHASPDAFWYDSDQHEWVLVLTRSAKLRFEGVTLEVKPGDYVNIPARTKHRVMRTTPDEPTVWLAVHPRRRSSAVSSNKANSTPATSVVVVTKTSTPSGGR